MLIIESILGLFGYVRIPLDIVKLSIEQEGVFERLYEISIPEHKIMWEYHLRGQKMMTEFLRSCRKISYRKEK